MSWEEIISELISGGLKCHCAMSAIFQSIIAIIIAIVIITISFLEVIIGFLIIFKGFLLIIKLLTQGHDGRRCIDEQSYYRKV